MQAVTRYNLEFTAFSAGHNQVRLYLDKRFGGSDDFESNN